MFKPKGSLASTKSVPNLSALKTQQSSSSGTNAHHPPPTTTSTTTTTASNNLTQATTALSYYYAHTPLPPHHQHLLNSLSSETPQLSVDDVQQLSEMLYFPKYKKATHSAVCYRCKHQIIQIAFEVNNESGVAPKQALLKVYDPNNYNLSLYSDNDGTSTSGSNNTEGVPPSSVDTNEASSVALAATESVHKETVSSPAVSSSLDPSSSFLNSNSNLMNEANNNNIMSQHTPPESPLLSVNTSNLSELSSMSSENNSSSTSQQPSTPHTRAVTFALPPTAPTKKSPLDMNPLFRESFANIKTPTSKLSQQEKQDKKRFSFNPNAKKKEAQQKQLQLEKQKEEQQLKFQQRMTQLTEEVEQLEPCVISNEEYEMNVEFVKQLYQYVSNTVQIDTPLCMECMEQVASQLNIQLEKSKEEENIYQDHYSKLLHDNRRNESETDLENELHQLEEEEKLLRLELDMLQRQEEDLSTLERSQMSKEEQFSDLQQRYWKEYNDFHNELLLYNEEREAVQQRIVHVSKEMEKLNSTNIFNDAFHIWYEGHFGTINNFRLGKLSTQNVEWNEINAAWGQAALLLFSLSKHKHFAFSKYKIIPMGSFSKIETLDNKNSYDLFGGGSNGGLFWQSKFDKAMVAFLYCLKEIGTFAEKQDTYFELPYKITDDKIGGKSIKLGNDENWTRACKYVLTDLKYLISFCVSK
ncbi:hypothetical protein C9374_000313 [Naegleria lovaniensis]|uniref:Autophagy-related protein 6 n=1 Tax=Naegleria lovaniensis TaxID=51637 RepID=A0AA88GZJ9_NAELO|nr:uncharacterized protein C9374_000313 [Naegleria lovaniensis]KAG2388874.1 hypothetical protein C9374_000313 [Naegleria lovaniensis]